jgi:predicted nucleic acid-binding protein
VTPVRFAADTSVWIDALRGHRTRAVALLQHALRHGERVAITDIVLTEILQGLADREVPRVTERLDALPLLRLESLEDFRRSAALYRAARAAGRTVRSTTDCLIASVCIREGVPLLHADRDFDTIAEVSELTLVPVADSE